MYVDGDRVEQETIGDVFGRVVSDGKNYATARIEVVKQTALDKVDKAKLGVALIAGAGLLAYAALIALLVSFVMALAEEIGAFFAGLIVTAIALVVAFVLFNIGMGRLSVLTSPTNEKIR